MARVNVKREGKARMANGDILLEATNLRKSYTRGREVPVLRGVDLTVHEGECVAIIGTSGSGKSTLLHLLGALDQPASGDIRFRGTSIVKQTSRERDAYRNRAIGYVFQFFHLLPELTALENVMLPAMVQTSLFSYWRESGRIRRQAMALLERMELGPRAEHRPGELSGGEMQRAAIARALITQPALLLADELTGNLDNETGAAILDLLLDFRRTNNLTIIMVTHDPDIARRADRVLRLTSGQLEEYSVFSDNLLE